MTAYEKTQRMCHFYLWALYCVPMVKLSIFMKTPQCYCDFIISQIQTVSNRGLVTRIHEEYLQFDKNNQITQFLKMSTRFAQYTLIKKVY